LFGCCRRLRDGDRLVTRMTLRHSVMQSCAAPFS
jgi:hypothetical protein